MLKETLKSLIGRLTMLLSSILESWGSSKKTITPQDQNSSPESKVEYFNISDVEYIGLTTYFEYLFDEGYAIQTFDKIDALQMGYDRAIPITTVSGGVFYVATTEEVYQSAFAIGDPDKYFKAYNYLLNKEYEKIIKGGTKVPFG